MTTEEKFNAAVNVIRNLPKNGSYQPSNELMLRFYAYFKQATNGPCTGRRPAFYDVVGRAKYDSWKRLGDMPKHEAMKKYVDELHTIVETMSYSDNVANFLEAPTNELDSINMDDLELIAGDVIERVRSQPNSPLASREASPIRLQNGINGIITSNNLGEYSEHSDDEYSDTIEFSEVKMPSTTTSSTGSTGFDSGTIIGNNKSTISKEHISRSRTKYTTPTTASAAAVTAIPTTPTTDISQELSNAIQNLKSDIERLTIKLNNIEKKSLVSRQQKRNGIELPLLAFLLAWPFLAIFITNRLIYNKRT